MQCSIRDFWHQRKFISIFVRGKFHKCNLILPAQLHLGAFCNYTAFSFVNNSKAHKLFIPCCCLLLSLNKTTSGNTDRFTSCSKFRALRFLNLNLSYTQSLCNLSLLLAQSIYSILVSWIRRTSSFRWFSSLYRPIRGYYIGLLVNLHWTIMLTAFCSYCNDFLSSSLQFFLDRPDLEAETLSNFGGLSSS